MTAEEAYRKGQEDMRRRICKQWRGYMTCGVSGAMRAYRGPHGHGYANVPVLIRAVKVRDLQNPERK